MYDIPSSTWLVTDSNEVCHQLFVGTEQREALRRSHDVRHIVSRARGPFQARLQLLGERVQLLKRSGGRHRQGELEKRKESLGREASFTTLLCVCWGEFI